MEGSRAQFNPWFDSLRAWAAFVVVGGHCNGLIPWSWVAMISFFVLSGYLISRSWLALPEEGRVRSYVAHRVARIAPLYWFYLLLLLGLFSVGFFVVGFPVILGPLLGGYYAWFPLLFPVEISVFYSHLWSLSVEFHYYLLLPAFFIFVPRSWWVRSLLCFVFLAPLLRIGIYLWALALGREGFWVELSVYMSPVTYLDSFALGALLALLPRTGWLARPGLLLGGYLLVLVLLLGIFAYLTMPSVEWWQAGGFPFLQEEGDQWIWGYSVLSLGFALLVLLLDSSFSSRWYHQVFDNPVTRYVGRISYGVYVYHPLVLGFTFAALGLYAEDGSKVYIPWWVFFLVFTISVAVASLSYHKLEIPLGRFFRSRMSGFRRKS